MSEPRQIAIVRTYAQLIEVLRQRSDELGLKRAALDELALAGDGHFSRLLAPTHIKHLGPKSFEAALAVLGVALIAVEDLELVERMRRRAAKYDIDITRNAVCAKNGTMRANHMRAKDKGGNPYLQDPEYAREFGRIMGLRSRLKLTPAQRRRSASKAARARWAQWRRKRKARKEAL
jgi:hypothetical protein